MLLEAETGDLARQRLETMEDLMRREMRTAGIRIEGLSTQNGQLSFRVADPNQLGEARAVANRQTQPVGFGSQPDWTIAADNDQIIMRPTQAGLDNAITSAMEVARDVIDRRINSLGTLEPTIIQQGDNRIVVQVPGMQDPEALKRLIGRTARLEFRMVDQTATPEMLQAGRAPVGSVILPTAEGGRIAVQRRAMISGDQIADARQDFDQQDGTPNVVISFDVDRRPPLRPGDSGECRPALRDHPRRRRPLLSRHPRADPRRPGDDLRRRLHRPDRERARHLAALRPHPGRAARHRGAHRRPRSRPRFDPSRASSASIAATLVVILFMLITYGRFGVYTTIGLIVNALMILGIMAFFNTTLTLPGIAGFVLTIGAAVDANVLINERIREEQRKGKKLLDALESGYTEASTAIFDANITNVIAAVLMFYFGSGPIRGFAIVLASASSPRCSPR